MGRLFTALGCLLPCISLVAQSVAQPPNDRQIVHLNIVATDNHGHPVTDLASSDLQISDEGKPQQILYLRRMDRRLSPPSKLAPNEISNRTAATIPHATVILLDLLNERLTTSAYASHELTKYLQSLESADYLYLYMLTVDGRVFPVRGLDAEQPAGNPQWTKDSKRIIEQATNAVVHARPIYQDIGTRIEWTFNALSALGGALARVPGRKNIVWITDGIPIELGPIRSGTGDVVDFTSAVRQLSLAFERFQIAIYPVQMIMLGSSQSVPDVPGSRAGDGLGAVPVSRETLDQFAAMTGGRPTSGKDIGAAVTQAMNDARTSYDAGYAPPDANWDGKFHKLRVTCSRKGVRIQAKSGYYASPQSATQRALEAIRPVAANPLDASEIGLRGTISSVPGTPNTSRVDVSIDESDVLSIKEGGRQEISVIATAVPYQPGIAPTAIPPLTPVDTGSTKSPLHFTRDLSLAPGITAVRVIVYDELGGTVGSLTFPIRAVASAVAPPNSR